ncbi:MAG: galactose-1-phosphate uridylyltransferase [Candidatus Desulforudis sp.]|nr:galactose-1-phosphate uridylyltransferase [Desulforudis sp.]
MPEWRKDPVVDRWVIIATERAKRPVDFRCPPDELHPGNCPLCVGNEDKTPPEILAFREAESPANRPGWWVRVVPNKFPAVRADERYYSWRDGVYEAMNGIGVHEVIVESTDHEPDLINQTDYQVEEVLWAWRARSLDLRADTRLKYIQIFKNKGRTGGASLEHTHSQLVGIPMVPVDVSQELAGFHEYRRNRGTCVFCDMVQQEIARQERVVMENDRFVCLSPYAARFPFEMWIVPKHHQPDFGQIGEEDVRELAPILRGALGKLDGTVCQPPYNMVLHTAPINVGGEIFYHWHFEILPRLTILAGYELGTGYFINPTPPELAAEALRETAVPAPHQIPTTFKEEVLRYV